MNEEEKAIVIALPFAGGSQFSYKVLERNVSFPFEWYSVEIPGRGTRINEITIPDILSVCEDIYQQILPIVRNYSFMFFGHGMGALLGYELTRMLTENDEPVPLCLFFTGQPGPSIKRTQCISRSDRDVFWKEVRKLGGLSDELFNDRELIDLFEPTIRADYRALEQYSYTPLEEPFEIPIFLRSGSEDVTDWPKMEAWQEETAYPLNYQVYQGNHFFIFSHIHELLEDIEDAYETAMNMTFEFIRR